MNESPNRLKSAYANSPSTFNRQSTIIPKTTQNQGNNQNTISNTYMSLFPDQQEGSSYVFEGGVTPSMRNMMNEKNSLSKIQPDTWLNIPVCLVKSIKQLIENFQNQQLVLKEMNERQNERERLTLNRFKKLESLIYEKDEAINKVIDQTERQIYDKVRKIQLDVESTMEKQEYRISEIYNNSFQDREYMHHKLSGVEDSKVIRDYIENQLISMEHRFRKQQFDYQDEIDRAFAILKDENLIIPGLIGQNESFANLRGWVSYMNTHVQLSFNEYSDKFNKKLQKKQEQQKQDFKERLLATRESLMYQITQTNEKLASTHQQTIDQFKQEINEKLLPVKQEQSSMQNLIQFFEKKIEQLKQEFNGFKNDEEKENQIENIKDTLTNEVQELKDDYSKRIHQVDEDLRAFQLEREESFRKMIDSLKAEIRINNQEKQKNTGKVEMTEKLKRQIYEMIQQTIEKTRMNSSAQSTNLRASSSINENTTGLKFKNSLMVKRDNNNSLLANNQSNDDTKKTRNSYFQQQQQSLLHARARSTLDNYPTNGNDKDSPHSLSRTINNNNSIMTNKFLVNQSIPENESYSTNLKTITDFNDIRWPPQTAQTILDPATQFALHLKNLKLQKTKNEANVLQETQNLTQLPSLNQNSININNVQSPTIEQQHQQSYQPQTQQQQRRQNVLMGLNRALTPLTNPQINNITVTNSTHFNHPNNKLSENNIDYQQLLNNNMNNTYTAQSNNTLSEMTMTHQHLLQQQYQHNQNSKQQNLNSRNMNNANKQQQIQYSTVQIGMDDLNTSQDFKNNNNKHLHNNSITRNIQSRGSGKGSESKSQQRNNKNKNNQNYSTVRPKTQQLQNSNDKTNKQVIYTSMPNNDLNVIYSQSPQHKQQQQQNQSQNNRQANKINTSVLAVKFETFDGALE